MAYARYLCESLKHSNRVVEELLLGRKSSEGHKGTDTEYRPEGEEGAVMEVEGPQKRVNASKSCAL